jgi:hypothetical protein
VSVTLRTDDNSFAGKRPPKEVSVRRGGLFASRNTASAHTSRASKLNGLVPLLQKGNRSRTTTLRFLRAAGYVTYNTSGPEVRRVFIRMQRACDLKGEMLYVCLNPARTHESPGIKLGG